MTQHIDEHGRVSATASESGHARGMAQEAVGAAQDVADEARAAGSTLREEAAGLGSSLKQGLTRQVERQKDGIAERIAGIAERAERSADELRGQEAWLAGLLGRGARELHGVADEIRGNDVAGILESVEVFARRQPALFTGAAVALGFALSRVVRGEASATRGYGEARATRGYEDDDYGPAAAYDPAAAARTRDYPGSAYELGSHERPERLVSGSNV